MEYINGNFLDGNSYVEGSSKLAIWLRTVLGWSGNNENFLPKLKRQTKIKYKYKYIKYIKYTKYTKYK